ncbi:hypothetical protein RRG08_015162 [Elysia crispata]|uniref:WSC domain-containing protein n=1 Tax=Elysia crispata TaxID=231223 RepID=A0AAE1E8W0_9GAST|nr:hypothetical protein RRG08_015162 [Elysia crispata]
MGQTQYRCLSGLMFDTSIRSDQSETVITQCDSNGQWVVVQGAVLEANSTLQFDCKGTSEYMGCYSADLTSSPGSTVTSSGRDETNIRSCRKLCRDSLYVYAALQGVICRCVAYSQFESTKVVRERCDVTCPNNALYCGGHDEHSIYRTIDSCVGITEKTLIGETSRYMYSSDTCVQFCRGQDKPLALYRALMRMCTCFDSIPTQYDVLNSLHCNVPYDSTANWSPNGYLFSTMESANLDVHNCEDLFDLGIYFHGYYYMQNSTKIYCNFLDGSAVCDQAWIAYNGHCYHFVEKKQNAVAQATQCRNSSSMLVSVGDSAEWLFLMKLDQAMPHIYGSIFIGLYDILGSYTYQWADETAFTYRPFAANNPAPLNGHRQCVIYGHSQLSNGNCHSARPALCEKSDKNFCMETSSLHLFTPSTMAMESESMSIPLCFETCRGEGHDLSVLNGTQCYCFTDGVGIGFDEVPMIYCDLPCANHPFQICGSTSYNYFFVSADVGQPRRESCDAMILDGLTTRAMVEGEATRLDCSAAQTADTCTHIALLALHIHTHIALLALLITVLNILLALHTHVALISWLFTHILH